MKQSLSNLMSIPDVQEIMDCFTSTNRIAVELLDAGSHIVIASSGRKSFAEVHRHILPPQAWRWQTQGGIRIQMDGGFSARSLRLGGLLRYASEVSLQNRSIATLILGPVSHAPLDEAGSRLLADELGFDAETYLEAVREAPVVTEAQIAAHLKFLGQLIQHLAEQGLHALRLRENVAATHKRQASLERAYQELEARIQERSEELVKANSALQESEQRFRVALVDTPVIVFNQDLELRYTWIYNPQGYANQPILGKTDSDLFAAEDAMRLTALKRRVIGAGLLTREEVAMTVDDRTAYYDMTLEPLYDENGAVTGLTCAATDVTDRKQRENQLRRILTESEGLRRIAEALLQKTGLDGVLEIVCTEAMQLTGGEGSAILLLDKEGWLRLTHRTGSPAYNLDRLPVEGSIAGRAIQTRSPVWVNRGASDGNGATEQWQGLPWTPGLKSMLSVPLKVNSQVIGVLNILDKPGDVTQEDIRVISLFADQAAINIEHVRLQHQAEQVAVLEERQRLARDLHDSVTQALYSVTLYADAARMAFATEKWEALDRNLQEVRKMAREAMYDMRLLVFELRPLMLEKEGLASALRARLAAVEGRAGLKTDVLVEGERRLPFEIEKEIYRIAQEGLNNVIKHAKASEVQIRIAYGQDSVRLEMIDDGIGFDTHIANANGGVGLPGIHERVKQLGGKLEIESALGRGTHLAVTIPI